MSGTINRATLENRDLRKASNHLTSSSHELQIRTRLIWDRSQTHRARVVKEYLATEREISVEWLPPYAPELNPEESCHGNVKEQIRNTTPESVEETQQQVDRGFNRLRRHPDLLLSFFHHAGLGVKGLFENKIAISGVPNV